MTDVTTDKATWKNDPEVQSLLAERAKLMARIDGIKARLRELRADAVDAKPTRTYKQRTGPTLVSRVLDVVHKSPVSAKEIMTQLQQDGNAPNSNVLNTTLAHLVKKGRIRRVEVENTSGRRRGVRYTAVAS